MQIESLARCKWCGKELTSNHVRTAAFNGANANFCDKWCYLRYCESLEPMYLKRIALSAWLQLFGQTGATGKRVVPSRASPRARKIMESFYFTEKSKEIL